jgi:soluble epoxide hydrolase / lipid-phosphate phosphatase
MTGHRVIDTHVFVLQELRYYISQFRRGMQGPLSYYRTSKVRHEEEQGFHISFRIFTSCLPQHYPELAAKLPSYLRSDLPVLFLWGTADPTCTQLLIQKSHKFIPGLQDIPLDLRGHWLMVEAKDTIVEKVLEWLDEVVTVKVKL